MTTTTAASGGRPAPATQTDSAGGLTHKQILTILGGLMAGMFLAALDQTVVSTAIRTIADDLNGISLQAWVTTAYLITSTIATPLYGKLSDIYGRRPFFLLAITLFVIGSVACTFAWSMESLAAFRAFQGLGAGGLFSLALAIIGDILAPRERAKYQGYFLAVFGTSSVIGPLVGGLFAGAPSILGITGWRWVFLINVPIGVVALAIVFKVLHIPHTPREHRIDWWGAVALIVGLVPMLLVAEQGREWGWSSTASIVCYVLTVVGLAAFIRIEFAMGNDALIPMRLFKDKTFSLVQGSGILVGMAMFGAILTIPLFLQIVRGATPTQSGLQMLAMTIGIMSASIISGQLTAKTGKYKIFPVLGLPLLIIAAALFALVLQTDSPSIVLWVLMFLIGFGIGTSMQTLTLAAQNAVPPTDIGVATSTATFFRQTGGTIGVAVFLSLLFSKLGDNISTRVTTAFQSQDFLAAAAQQAGSQDPAAIRAVVTGFGQQMSADTSFLQRVDPVLAQPYQLGFVDSMRPVFLAAAVVALLAWILILFMKEVPLRTMSALQERQQAEAEAAAVAAGSAGGNADDALVMSKDDELVGVASASGAPTAAAAGETSTAAAAGTAPTGAVGDGTDGPRHGSVDAAHPLPEDLGAVVHPEEPPKHRADS
ncbi:MDR family MFS transporter [Nakamurella sp. A5-74]|uniref:MDR family MFS transporter n=1 Tax=Nakamurella sp. A5-74 TaxID=3158264 RepID=A0AAU8DT82_9ACTN